MELMIRTYQELDYFEKHIVEILMNEYGHDQKTSVDVINEYSEVLNVLKDGHETANAFAKMFNEAYTQGTSGNRWLTNIVNYLFDSVKEIQEFGNFLNRHETGITTHYEGSITINEKKYVRIYVGENHPTHTVRWNTFLVSIDMTDIKILDIITFEPTTLDEWRRSEFYSKYDKM